MEPHHPEAASSSPAQMRCITADRELIAAIFLAGLFVEAADNLINALAATPPGDGTSRRASTPLTPHCWEREPYRWLIVPPFEGAFSGCLFN